MQNKKRTPLDAQQSHLWIIGGGIAGMAAAAFAIRDAKVPAKNIHILEELDISGGSMDGGQAKTRYPASAGPKDYTLAMEINRDGYAWKLR